MPSGHRDGSGLGLALVAGFDFLAHDVCEGKFPALALATEVRIHLVSLLAAEPDMKVVGEGATGRDAVEMASRLTPDLITMDVHMPVMDGLEATKQIMIQTPRPIIIVSSAVQSDEVELSMEAMRAGALMVMTKPQGPASPGFDNERRQFVSMVRAMSDVPLSFAVWFTEPVTT